eukprot:3785673-Prymnesium_polylepis.1
MHNHYGFWPEELHLTLDNTTGEIKTQYMCRTVNSRSRAQTDANILRGRRSRRGGHVHTQRKLRKAARVRGTGPEGRAGPRNRTGRPHGSAERDRKAAAASVGLGGAAVSDTPAAGTGVAGAAVADGAAAAPSLSSPAERAVRSFRPTARPKAKAKVSAGPESVDFRDGASLILAVVSDLNQAKAKNFEGYCESKDGPEPAPVAVQPVGGRLQPGAGHVCEEREAALGHRRRPGSSRYLPRGRGGGEGAARRGRSSIHRGRAGLPVDAALELSHHIRIDGSGVGSIEYADSANSNASIYGGWGGEGYTNTRDARAVPTELRWQAVGTTLSKGSTLREDCDPALADLLQNNKPVSEVFWGKKGLVNLELADCVKVDGGGYYQPAAKFSPAVKAEPRTSSCTTSPTSR